MRVRFAIALLATAAVAAACLPSKPPPPPPCRATPNGGEALGDERYREPIFGTVAVACDVEYGRAPDENGRIEVLTLDVYVPIGDTAIDRPVLVWLPWGGFIIGNKADPPHPEYATRFARRGYVVVVPQYRLREGSTFSYAPPFSAALLEAATDAQHDAQAAVRWVRRYAGDLRIDPGRIVTVGISAGGMTALNVDYDESDVGTSGNPGYASDVTAAISLEGCALDLSVIDGGEGEALLVHSTADAAVPYGCAVDTRDAAESAGDVAVLDPRSGGEPHGFTQDPAQTMASIIAFLGDHVTGP